MGEESRIAVLLFFAPLAHEPWVFFLRFDFRAVVVKHIWMIVMQTWMLHAKYHSSRTGWCNSNDKAGLTCTCFHASLSTPFGCRSTNTIRMSSSFQYDHEHSVSPSTKLHDMQVSVCHIGCLLGKLDRHIACGCVCAVNALYKIKLLSASFRNLRNH